MGVGERLLPFLPAPRVRKAEDGSYALDYDLPQSIGHIGPFYGSFGVVLKALAYMMRLGAEGLTRAAEFASLNANYLRKKLEGVLDVPFDRICAHEFVASAPEGLRALDIAKALLDRGFHAPTVYFRSSSMNASWPSPRRPRASRPWMPTSRPCARSWPWASPIPAAAGCPGEDARAPPGRDRGRAPHDPYGRYGIAGRGAPSSGTERRPACHAPVTAVLRGRRCFWGEQGDGRAGGRQIGAWSASQAGCLPPLPLPLSF